MSDHQTESGEVYLGALAAICHDTGDKVDRLIADLASDLQEKGYRVAGLVHAETTGAPDDRCGMQLKVLSTGTIHSISQQLGPGASGCHLDVSALERAVTEVEAGLADDLDILILNKFGAREAEGGGLRDVIAQAIAAHIPVIIGLNRAYVPDWARFCDGQGEMLKAERDAIDRWLDRRLRNAAVTAGRLG